MQYMNNRRPVASVRGSVPGGRRGVTLLEMMLVVLIIGMIATISIVAVSSNLDRARRTNTISRMSMIKSSLQQYQMDNASYPETLTALVPKYLEKVPKDEWKRDFVYRSQGTTGNNEQPFDLLSTGKSGEMGGQDNINVWNMDPTNQPTQ